MYASSISLTSSSPCRILASSSSPPHASFTTACCRDSSSRSLEEGAGGHSTAARGKAKLFMHGFAYLLFYYYRSILGHIRSILGHSCNNKYWDIDALSRQSNDCLLNPRIEQMKCYKYGFGQSMDCPGSLLSAIHGLSHT